MLKVSNYERVVRSTTVELDCVFALLACTLHSYECQWLGFLLFALLRMQEVFVSFEKSGGASFGHPIVTEDVDMYTGRHADKLK